MPVAGKRPCSICRRWFRPDVRVGSRQRACGRPECQTARSQGIGQKPIVPSGRYDFKPGEEMRHDTSPHEFEAGGRKYNVQTAQAILFYPRMLFFHINPTFQRFDCKVFLTDALRYMGGSVERAMIDNTHFVSSL